MTVQELSAYLHVHPSTVYRLLKRRGIPAFKVGSDWRFNLESIEKWRKDAEQTTDAKVAKDPPPPFLGQPPV